MTTVERIEKAIADMAEHLVQDPQSTSRREAIAILVDARNAIVTADARALVIIHGADPVRA